MSKRLAQPGTVTQRVMYWLRTNSTILSNAASLVGTTVVTSVLGFAYWFVAARYFPTYAVGLSSALISTMSLISMFCTLGMGTMLVGELPQRQGEETRLITTALLVVGSVGTFCGLLFALIAPLLASDFQILHRSLLTTLLFAVGVGLTTMTLVTDQALIGLLRGDLQLWRNTLFAGCKLLLLFLISFLLLRDATMAIYATWLVGVVFSLLLLLAVAVFKGAFRARKPHAQGNILSYLGRTAIQHHLLNILLQLPSMALPTLVTIILSATQNAWFYVAFMLANFVYVASRSLATVLFAVRSPKPHEMARKMRLTVGTAMGFNLFAVAMLSLGSRQVLSIFNPGYAQHASASLALLCLGAFPITIKDHYVAIARVEQRMKEVLLPIALSALLELTGAAVGAYFFGLAGISAGFVLALCIEALFQMHAVYHVARFGTYKSGLSLSDTLVTRIEPESQHSQERNK